MLILTSCKKEKGKIIIDNPSDNVVKIKLAQLEEFKLEPYTKVEKEIEFGKQNILINNKTSYEINLEGGIEYVLNPTLSPYYIENRPYFISERGVDSYLRDYGSNISTEIGLYKLPGDFTILDSILLIRKQWDFGLDEDEDVVTLTNSKRNTSKGYRIVKLLTRKSDITLKAFNEVTGRSSFFEK